MLLLVDQSTFNCVGVWNFSLSFRHGLKEILQLLSCYFCMRSTIAWSYFSVISLYKEIKRGAKAGKERGMWMSWGNSCVVWEDHQGVKYSLLIWRWEKINKKKRQEQNMKKIKNMVNAGNEKVKQHKELNFINCSKYKIVFTTQENRSPKEHF